MSFNFKRKPLVDKKAAEGINVPVVENDINYGTFKVRFIAKHLPEVERELNMARKRRARELGVTKLSDNENAFALLVEYALIGWSDIESEDGKQIEFSREAAYEFFDDDYMWIVEKLLSTALDSGKYQPVEAFDIAKNS